MHETTTAPPLAWSRAFPAAPMQIREARRFLADLLNGHPATEDAVLCLSELATNATLHSNSAQPGGQFTVLAGLDSDHLRVEVQDEDGPWTRPAPGDERGHGLSIVSQLARVWGVSGDCHTGWTVWAEIACPCPAGSMSGNGARLPGPPIGTTSQPTQLEG